MDIAIHIMILMNYVPQFLCLHIRITVACHHTFPCMVIEIFTDLKSLLSATNDIMTLTVIICCYCLIRVFWTVVPFGMLSLDYAGCSIHHL